MILVSSIAKELNKHFFFFLELEDGDGQEEVGVKGEIFEPETTLEVNEKNPDATLLRCNNCPRKFHRQKALEKHQQVRQCRGAKSFCQLDISSTISLAYCKDHI